MAKEKYWFGVQQAFMERLNLLMIGAGAVSAAILHPPLTPHVLAGAAALAVGEAVWTLGAPLLPLYQYRMRQKRLARKRAERDRSLKRLLATLSPELGRRFNEVKRLHEDIRAAARDTGAVASDLLAEELDKLEALQEAFLRLLATWMRYRQYLNKTDENAIVKDLAHLRGKLERTIDPDTQRIIKQNLDILEKRLERIEAIQRGYLNLQAHLEVIEDTFQLINDQMVSMRTPDALKIDLAQIVSGVEMTEAVLQETNALIEQPALLER